MIGKASLPEPHDDDYGGGVGKGGVLAGIAEKSGWKIAAGGGGGRGRATFPADVRGDGDR